MTFPSLAALVITGGAALLVAMLALLGLAPGVPLESKHLREMKNRLEVPFTYETLSFASHRALPSGVGVGEYSASERHAVTMEGRVQRMLIAGDGDLHLELNSSVLEGAMTDSAYVSCEITPGFRLGSERWRFEPLAEVFRPRHGSATPWEGGPARVRVSGWLTYDVQYARLPSAWQVEHGAPRLSGWEIHPVTRIERWDEALQGFREVPR
ncbi:MAG: hypothetical protein ABIU54_02555 [Candidatus Eisenbacteria bacterium]